MLMVTRCVRVLLAALLVGVLLGAPLAYYRWQYSHAKRLRVVTPGVLYRAGQMTQAGLDEAVRRFGIRTVVNFQNEAPDPVLSPGLPESERCKQLGVEYLFLPPDLIERKRLPAERPEAIGQFLKIMDDPSCYPILIHCRAGLHRTGILAAIYRMEYQGWSRDQAMQELKENGFGDSQCTARNDYIMQYLLLYQPRLRSQESGVRSHESEVRGP
jgi:tyrosine-protein phosphatase SIW14